MELDKGRVAFLDVAKGVGIILVVLGHGFWNGPYPSVCKFIYNFHMPMFFFVAGMFFKSADFNGIMPSLSRCWNCYGIPFMLFSVLWWVMQSVAGDFHFNLGILSSVIHGRTFISSWFLSSLALTAFSFALLIRFFSRSSRFFSRSSNIYISVFSCVIAVAFNYLPSFVKRAAPLMMTTVPCSLMYYSVGFLLRDFLINKICRVNKVLLLLCSLLGFALVWALAVPFPLPDMDVTALPNPLSSIPASFIGLFSVFGLAYSICGVWFLDSVFSFIGRYSLVYFLSEFHVRLAFSMLGIDRCVHVECAGIKILVICGFVLIVQSILSVPLMRIVNFCKKALSVYA